ncbi:hypothetical protein [Cryobacterium soli]|uniref:hypothetical protein n=1 Tax=Cryobacterium soli TaxID=2220095 RepID=UPI000E746597|nr:hypothetical protein [Cryobacterium soli]
MPTVDGVLLNYQGASMAGLSAQIHIIPITPAVGGSKGMFSTPTIVVVPDEYGVWSVTLQRTDMLRPVSGYRVEVVWLNGADIPVGFDQYEGVLQVPGSGGSFPDLFETGGNPQLAWDGSTPPPGTYSPGQLWLNTNSGILSVWS